jgi:tetratricopeptide (TPR) repeat protein
MGIADAYGLLTVHGQIPAAAGIRAGEQAAAKAIALDDPSLAEAHAALGMLQAAAWQWQDACDEYQRAIALNPSYDRAYLRYGLVCFFRVGDFSGAERMIRESETLNPYSLALPTIRAELYYYARRYRDALARFSHSLLGGCANRQFPSGFPQAKIQRRF